ncbi:MAG: hypothetical protein DWQ02_20290 [Bacteroidetes bacterium]|nr:MAG: hypothetical protein DWQ02_20290 [Bacteroidota bacterium]
MTTRHNSLKYNQENYNLKKSYLTTHFNGLAKRTITFLFALFVMLSTLPVMASVPATADNSLPFAAIESTTVDYDQKSFFDAISADNIINVTIETNITELIENRKVDKYMPATMKWQDNSGIWNTYEVGVKPRGKFRRRICDFPPLKIKLSKNELAESGFATYNKLKLVTHCVEDKGEGNSNLIKEYLAYKLYNELNANSFRVQLIKITYVDNVGDYGEETRYGFIIESKKELAARLGGVECEDCYNPTTEMLSGKDLGITAIFQYMIGNADWDIPMVKNLALVKLNEGKMIPVPYDFDFAGLVSTDYAIPNPNYGLTSIKDRVYLGTELNNNQMRTLLKYFVDKKKDLERIVKDLKPLKFGDRQEVLGYLNEFYSQAELLLSTNGVNIYEALKNAHTKSVYLLETQPLGK